MRHWDLTSGAAKLDGALKSLRAAAAEIGESWDDENYRRFVETYIEPLEPRMKNLLTAVQGLAEVLAGAERACGEES
jgi:hypothetical protein